MEDSNMKVCELVEELLTLPQDAEVMKSNHEGCPECNPEAMEYYQRVNTRLEYYEAEKAPYPNHYNKQSIVVL